MRKCIWCLLLAAILIIAAAAQVSADERIRVSGIVPFTYNNYSYVPVRPTCNYLNANLFWDPYANSATIFYRNRNLTLVVGTTQAYYGNEIVALPAPVVVVRDQLCCPAVAFSRYLDVGLRWEPRYHRAYFEGPPGWGYYDVDPICPPYALGVFASYGYVPVQPAPFLYGGVAFLPLRNVADLIGAALLFDLFNDRCVATYGGVQTVLFIGSPRCYYGDRVIVLPAAPIVCNNIVYVPAPLFENYWRVPVRREHGVFGLRGERGWRDFHFNPAPPAAIARSFRSAPFLRTAASGLRSAGITVPPDPGLISAAAHGTAARRLPRAGAPLPGTARARRGPGTGFPAIAAVPPRPGPSMLRPSAQRRAAAGAKAPVAASPRAGRAGARAGAAAAPRGAAKPKAGVAAPAPRGRGRGPQGAKAAPQRGAAKPKAGPSAAPPTGGRGRGQGGPAAAPRGRGAQGVQPARPSGGGRGRGAQGVQPVPPSGAGRAKGGPAAAPPQGGRPRGAPEAAPPRGGGPRGGPEAAPPRGGGSRGRPSAAPRGGGGPGGGPSAAPKGGGQRGRGKASQEKGKGRRG